MNRSAAFVSTIVAMVLVTQSSFAQAADPAFKFNCVSNSIKALPNGRAGAGKTEFFVEADPASQTVTINGNKKYKAKIDKIEVAFAADDHSISISRSMKTFGMIVPVTGLASGEPGVYLYYTGECK